MAAGHGIVTLDFGPFPGVNELVYTVTGDTAITATAKIEAYVIADDDTPQHSPDDHRWFAALVGLSCSGPNAGVGFNLYARSTEKISGTFKVRYVWAD
jgi:hypothetical protein